MDAAVVLTVSVAVTAPVPVIAGGAATMQVGGLTAAAGPVTAQDSATLPIKPPLGVTVMVDVTVPPGKIGPSGVLPPLSIKKPGEMGGPLTVNMSGETFMKFGYSVGDAETGATYCPPLVSA